MNIQITSSSKVIESKHYEQFLAVGEEESSPDCSDLAKILAVKRHLTVKPAEL